MPILCPDRGLFINRIAVAILITSAFLAPVTASFGQSFVRVDASSARDRSQRSSSPFSALQYSAQLGLGDVSVLRSLACPLSTPSALAAFDSLTSFEGLAIANVTQFSGFQTVAIDVWGGRNAADSYLVCTVKAQLPQSSNGSGVAMQLLSVTSGKGHAASSVGVQDAAASVGSFRSWLGGDPYYASSHSYQRYDEFAPVFGHTFARLLPDAPCALVTFGDSGVSPTSRYRMVFKLPFSSPVLNAFDFWVAPTLLASLQPSASPSPSIQALVVRGSKFGVRTRAAEDAFPAQPSSGCCPVATVPSPLYPGRCVLCSEHIFSSASIASWQPLNGSVSAADAACALPFAASAAACNQSAQSCSCSTGRGLSMCDLRLPPPASSTQTLVQALCNKYASNLMTMEAAAIAVQQSALVFSRFHRRWASTFNSVKQGSRFVTCRCARPLSQPRTLVWIRTHPSPGHTLASLLQQYPTLSQTLPACSTRTMSRVCCWPCAPGAAALQPNTRFRCRLLTQ